MHMTGVCYNSLLCVGALFPSTAVLHLTLPWSYISLYGGATSPSTAENLNNINVDLRHSEVYTTVPTFACRFGFF